MAKFDLTFNCIEMGENLRVNFEYCSKLFKPETMERFVRYFKTILDTVVETPDVAISQIDILSDKEREQILHGFNATSVHYPLDKTIHQMFEETAASHPDKIALSGPSQIAWSSRQIDASAGVEGPLTESRPESLTYRCLNYIADLLAEALREKGVREGKVVGVMMRQTPEMIIIFLGILKAGGVFLPIDPILPGERIDFMLCDSAAHLLITDEASGEKIAFANTITLQTPIFKMLDAQTSPSAAAFSSVEIAGPAKSKGAYIIYTSGSTGRPKGVYVEHRSLVNICCWYNRFYSVTQADRFAKYVAIGFDPGLLEIFPPLITGASLHIVGEENKLDIHRLNRYFEANRITLSLLPTQMCEQFMAVENRSLRMLTTGGDKLNRFIKRDYRFANNYGPTETTILATAQMVETESLNIPIGKPIDNSQVYIVDRYSRLQPVGVAGELCIAGTGLALGYLNNPELTAEKFQPLPPTLQEALQTTGSSPLSAETSQTAKLYRTGDLACWLPNGSILFLGRIDRQVKIRGFRIELGEIEFHLKKHPVIRDAVVIKKEGRGRQYLCAYYTLTETSKEPESQTAELKQYLAASMPGYMVPPFFVKMEVIPITAAGKTDLRALPEPDEYAGGSTYVAPGEGTQKIIAEIWQDILELEKVGIDDNFFDLGGNSLDFIKVGDKLNERLEKEIPVVMLFTYPTISALDAYLSGESGTAAGETSRQEEEGRDDLVDEGMDLMLDTLGRFDLD
ncbi:MAG: amino acid adenylation domain-containing protein [bacterium]|nr:amino acid adenylation domain-containing protein [bacterium]